VLNDDLVITDAIGQMTTMGFQDLLQPISEDAPCGPDLSAGFDDEFESYYFDALGRLPSYYAQPGVTRPDGTRTPDHIFDPADIDIRAEARAIDSLLTRSRDLRLLVLRAQWEALAHRLGPMAEAVEAIAALLETFPDAVHPTFAEGISERRDTIADLAQPVFILQPLQFAGLAGSNEVTLRKVKVAKGEVGPLSGEDDLKLPMLMDALADAGYRERVTQNHGVLVSLARSLARIDHSCQTHPQAPFTPALQPVRRIVQEMLDLIGEARPDLRDAEADVRSSVPEQAEDASQPTPEAPSKPAPVAAGPALDIHDHAHAKQVLEACEHYYRRYEPSSAALLLVTQARLLIGRPLIEAIETLLPKQASRTVVDFGPTSGFLLDLERLRALSQSAPETATQLPEPSAPVQPAPMFSTAPEAAAGIRSVENYFRVAERSSPIPTLLQRARSYLDKDFEALIGELIPMEA
jgi:type VI secretion system protein ImpA